MNTRRPDGTWAIDLDDRREVVDALKELMNQHESGIEYKNLCYTKETGDEDFELIIDACHTLFPDGHVTTARMADALQLLMDSGRIQRKDFEPAVPLEEPKPDTTLRDKNGKPLSASQLKWSEFRQFADSASMEEINRRKRTDPEFATFVRKNMEREMQEQPVGDGVENLNANRVQQQSGAPSDVRAYAARYRTMSAAEVKKERSPGMNPLGPAAAREANRLFEAACSDGLI